MNFTLETSSKIFLAMLVLVGAAFFVLPVKNEVQAQAGTPRGISYICVNSAKAGEFQKADTITNPSNPACPSGWFLYSGQTSEKGFCAGVKPPIETKNPKDKSVTGFDDTRSLCFIKRADGATGQMNFITFASVTQQYGSGTYIPPTNSNTGGNNTGGNNNSGGNSTSPQLQGNCEAGFHKVGPLCVPNSPFNNSNSITSEQTVGGLAVRIIRILLYFAGIVAVIMLIIGGYQIMTAAGNETQATNGRKTLTNAIIGLIIIILAYIIVQAVVTFITKG